MTAVNSGNDTITATWKTQTATEAVAVSNQNFSFLAPAANASIVVGLAQPITISWLTAGTGQTGTVNFTSSRGTLSAASAAVSGGALTSAVTISSTTAGPAIISATALNSSGVAVATAQVVVDFIATDPHSVSLQATPSTVPTQGQSTLTATVTDPTGNPVEGVTVGFTLSDPTGGSLSAASAVTTAQGLAVVTYTASTTSSTANGVSIQAQVQGFSVAPSTTTLTVGGQAVFLSLGTGNQLTANYSVTQYEMPYTVQAVDAAGNAVSGVSVTFSVQSIYYYTGLLDNYVNGSWLPADYKAGPCSPTTVNEYNGTINPIPPPVGVTPVVIAIPGSVVATDVGSAITSKVGTAAVNLIYPKDHAQWVVVALTATATVQGSQNSTTASFILPGLASDYTSQTTSPPGAVSPYGTSLTCY
jgi:hypothetical protein